jgi:hypothetical protein
MTDITHADGSPPPPPRPRLRRNAAVRMPAGYRVRATQAGGRLAKRKAQSDPLPTIVSLNGDDRPCPITAIGSRLSNSEVDWRAVNRRGKRRSTRLPRSLAKLWRAYYIPTRFGVGVRT